MFHLKNTLKFYILFHNKSVCLDIIKMFQIIYQLGFLTPFPFSLSKNSEVKLMLQQTCLVVSYTPVLHLRTLPVFLWTNLFGGAPNNQLTRFCLNTSRDGKLITTQDKQPFPLLNISEYLRALLHNELGPKPVISRFQVCSFCPSPPKKSTCI